MTRAERDRLRAEALRLLTEAAIAAGGDLGFPRSPIVKALLRQGAGRTFAYDILVELLDEGEVSAELERRGFLRRSADAAPAGPSQEAPSAAPIHLSGGAVAKALALLDQAGELLGEAFDHADEQGTGFILQAMRAAEEVEAILRGRAPDEASA